MREIAAPLGAGDVGESGVPLERVFLIGDVRGYTRFTREHGDAAAARLASRFAELARDAVEARGGRVIELRGDEALAVFGSASQAVRAGTELVAICADEASASAELPLLVGVGIDAGAAVPVEDGFRGAALNTAARLCSQAAAGQVLLTSDFVARHGDVTGVRFAPVGAVELKGFAGPVDIVQAIGEERPRPPCGVSEPLPFELETEVPLVGRARELAWLRGMWRQVARGFGGVVVISGPAGIGKTRLAAEAAAFASAHGGAVTYVGGGGDAAARALVAVRSAASARCMSLFVLDELDPVADALLPSLQELVPAIESRAALVLCLTREAETAAPVGRLLAAIDRQGGAHKQLLPLGPLDVAAIASLYAPRDMETVPLETITRSSGGVPGRVHELMSDWARQEAARRLEAAAEFLAADRQRRRSELDYANTVIGLKLARIFAPEPSRSPIDPAVGPFKGLASFEEADTALFFGREQLVGELAARTVGVGMLALVGASGSGKSSVIAAGLMPSLREGLLPGSDAWHTALIRPGDHPCAELEDVERPSGQRLVLAVDQFEEIFTLCADELERAEFVRRLVELAADPESAVVILGVRGDYYGHCAIYPELAEHVAANQVLVGPMSGDELRRAIELPARRAGVRVESTLSDALVAEIGDEPGGLPLLSTALVELWQERESGWLRLSALERLGGVRSAVARLAESSYEHFDEAERLAVRRLFLRLVASTEDGSIARRRVKLSELDLDREVDLATVVGRLTEDRLLTAQAGTVEVAHEALLREWPRFQEWLADDAQGRELREHLIQTARRWDDAGRDPSELLRGARLGTTLEWAAGREAELNAAERDLLVASRSHAESVAERQRRQNRRLRGLLAGATVLLLAAVAGAAVALQQRASAKHEATVALGRQLGAEAVSEPRIDRAMLLARESLNLDRSTQTKGTLLATLLREPSVTGTFALPIQDRPQRVQVSPDGRTIAVITNNNVMRFFATDTHRQLAPLAAFNLPYSYIADGSMIVAKSTPNTVYYVRVDAKTHRTLQKFVFSRLFMRTSNIPTTVLVATPDDRYLFFFWAVMNPNGSAGPAYAERWDLQRGGASDLVPLDQRDMLAATATRDGRLIVVTDGAVTTWDPDTMRRVGKVPSPVSANGQSPATAVSPDGRRVAYGLSNGTVEFLDVTTGNTTTGVGSPAPVRGLSFSPDSRLAASGSDDKLTIVWNPRTGHTLERLGGHGSRVLGTAFSSDGKTLYSASLDGTVLRYDIGNNARFGATFSVGAAIPYPRIGAFPLTVPFAISHDGRLLAARSADSVVGLFSVTSLQRQASIALPPPRSRHTRICARPSHHRRRQGARRSLGRLAQAPPRKSPPRPPRHRAQHRDRSQRAPRRRSRRLAEATP